MLKLTFALARRADLSREEFQRYWREVHAPLVAAAAPAIGIRRYHQVHQLPVDHPLQTQAARGGGMAYDGLAEIWFDDVEQMTAARSTAVAAEAARRLREDEARFIDASRSPMWWGRDEGIV